MQKDFEIYGRYYRDLKKEVFQINLFFPKVDLLKNYKASKKYAIPKLVVPESLFVTTTLCI